MSRTTWPISGVPCEKTDDLRFRRAISWKYQREIVGTRLRRTSRSCALRDFVLKQDEALAALARFLGFPLVKIEGTP